MKVQSYIFIILITLMNCTAIVNICIAGEDSNLIENQGYGDYNHNSQVVLDTEVNINDGTNRYNTPLFGSLSLVGRGPIVIDNDTDFAIQANDNGWSGDGTKNNLFVIEGYHIATSGESAINIKNTEAHFIIKNCLLEGATDMMSTAAGVKLQSVINGQVSNNTMQYNRFGVHVDFGSYNNTIANNTIKNNENHGIDLHGYNVTIDNNIIEKNGGRGGLYISANNTIVTNNTFIDDGLFVLRVEINEYETLTVENNTVNNKALGWFVSQNDLLIEDPIYGQLILVNCNNSMVTNQNIDSTNIAVDARFSHNLIVRDNMITNTFSGIDVSTSNGSIIQYNAITNGIDRTTYVSGGVSIRKYSYDTTITNNTILDHYWSGILISFSSDNLIANNTVSNHSWYGIYFGEHATHNIVENNKITNNQFSGIYIIGNNNTVMNNQISNSWAGIEIIIGSNILIFNNSINNNEFGIFMEGNYITIFNNIFKDNLYHGVRINGNDNFGHNSTIYLNSFVASYIYYESLGYDDGTNNKWYNETTQTGNFWVDWSGEGAYLIDGDANNEDPYPLSEPPIEDTIPPEISDVKCIKEIEEEDLKMISFLATVTDNFAVADVYLYYSFDDGQTWEQKKMYSHGTADGKYDQHIEVWESTFNITFYIQANDFSGNTATSEHQYCTAPDTIKPQISSIFYSPIEPTNNDEITISVTVKDNVEVEKVFLLYRVKGETDDWTEVTMTEISEDRYSATIGSFEAEKTIEFRIYAEDTSGNTEQSEIDSFNIRLEETDDQEETEQNGPTLEISFGALWFISLAIVSISLVISKYKKR